MQYYDLQKRNFLLQILGIELDKGIKTNKGWFGIADRMDNKIGGWKDKCLSKSCKVTKIKVVLSALPTYPLSYLPLSKNIIKKIEEKLRNLL